MADEVYLVTGGTGFLGAYVIRDLLARGRRVAALDLSADTDLLELLCGEDGAARVEVLAGDVAVPAQLFAAVRATGASILIHLASPLPPHSETDASQSLRSITQGHVNALDAARLFALRKVVWASAPSVFGSPAHHGGVEAPVFDDAPHYPVTLYGIAKSANERLSRHYWERFGVDSIGLRFCQGYGPGKKRGRAFGYRMFEDALRGAPCRIPYGDDVVNWQYVEDMAQATIAASGAPPAGGRTFNTSGHVVPVREALEVLTELVPGARLAPEPGVADLVWSLDTTGLHRLIDLPPSVAVPDGFRRTIDTLRSWQRLRAP